MESIKTGKLPGFLLIKSKSMFIKMKQEGQLTNNYHIHIKITITAPTRNRLS